MRTAGDMHYYSGIGYRPAGESCHFILHHFVLCPGLVATFLWRLVKYIGG